MRIPIAAPLSMADSEPTLLDSVHELTTRIARGDRDAFATFYRAWFDRMYNEARRVSRRDESFCLDVVHDAMLCVIRSLKPVDAPGRLHAFVTTVVRASAYDRLRSEQRRKRREEIVSAQAAGSMDETDETLTDQLAWLRREIVSLHEPGMGLLVMRFRLGWTLERIGQLLGLSAGAVDGRINRTVATLKKRVRERHDD